MRCSATTIFGNNPGRKMANDPTTSEDEKTLHQQCIQMTPDEADAYVAEHSDDTPAFPKDWAALKALRAEVRRLRGEAVLLNDMVKDADERALDDARAEVSEGVVALEGTCRDLSVKLSASDAEVRRLRADQEANDNALRQALAIADDNDKLRNDLACALRETAELRAELQRLHRPSSRHTW